MDRYMEYGPYICIGVVLVILFLMWVCWGGANYEFIGLAPLAPDTCASYTGSIYSWNNVTPAEPVAEAINPEEVTPAEVAPAEPEPIRGGSTFRDSEGGDDTTSIQMTEVPVQPPVVRSSPVIIPPRFLDRPRRMPSKGERICCQTLERIYGVPFRSIWPEWLVNPETGRKLELDCYNEDLRIAVEYNGEQHYHFPNHTDQSYEEFINQARRDQLKVEMCDRHGVYLIVVPYTVEPKMIPEFIVSHLPETIQQRIQDESILSAFA